MTEDLPEEISRFLEKGLKKKIENYIVAFHPNNKMGKNYLSEFLIFSLQDRNTKEIQHVVVKQLNSQTGFVKASFVQEIYFYNTLLPEFILINNGFKIVPKCIAIDDTSEVKKIAMENLKTQGFQPLEGTMYIDKDHFEIIFENYGKFHGQSMVYQKQHPEKFKEHSKLIDENYRTLMNHGTFLSQGVQDRCNDIHNRHKDNQKNAIMEKFKSYGKDLFATNKEYTGNGLVILHGDCWMNNYLFKYDQNKIPSDVRFIDFQFLSMGTPVYDLSHCFYSSASKESLDNLWHFLKIYYKSLSDTLKNFGFNLEESYSYDTFKEEWKKYSKWGFMLSLVTWYVKLLTSHDFHIDDVIFLKKPLTSEYFNVNYMVYDQIVENLLLHMYSNEFL